MGSLCEALGNACWSHGSLAVLILQTAAKSSKFSFLDQKAGVYNQTVKKRKRKKKAARQTLHDEPG